MECPSCKFVAAPGQVAEDGMCPNCERPYRTQPTPLNSDMAMRDMVAPGEEDMGGNPLREGILGDYDDQQKRDESYASVHAALADVDLPCPVCGGPTYGGMCVERPLDHKEGPDVEIPAEITGVLPPDPGSIHSALTDLYRKTHE